MKKYQATGDDAPTRPKPKKETVPTTKPKK